MVFCANVRERDADVAAAARIARRGPSGGVTAHRALACERCATDREFLASKERPDYQGGPSPLQLVDLFAGGGGLTVGVAEAARRIGRGMEVALAVENEDHAADVYGLNFPHANLVRAGVEALFDGELGAPVTASERSIALAVGGVDILVAGPPCQGHSNLNNHTRREDPRNALYLRAVRAAEVLRPTLVVIENVPTVRHDKGGVVERSTQVLKAAGYSVASDVFHLVKFGVPQQRRRHILLAALNDRIDPSVMGRLGSVCDDHAERSVRWAIEDLVDQTAQSGPDAASRPAPVNLKRMQWLIDRDEYDLPNERRPKCHQGPHSYNSMYGRLRWDVPAQTITTGFGCMGQGRFMHPAKPRTITPHEAARLQTLPDFFDLDAGKGRGVWARVIGNAVPPLFVAHLLAPLIGALPPRAAEPTRLADSPSGKSAAPPVLNGASAS